MDYILHLLIYICVYLILTQSLSLVAGHARLMSLAHAGFYGIGAYTSAILATKYSLSFIFVIPVSMIITGIIAFIVSSISLRTVDDYFIICTLGIQVIIFSLMNNWVSLTRGPLGIPGIPAITLFKYSFESKLSYFLLCIFFVSIIWYLIKKLTASPFGRVLLGLSEDEIFCKSLGKDVNKAKIFSFTFSAMLASIAGVLFSHYITYIDPTNFKLDESIFILSIVIIGGMRNLLNIALATILIVSLPEILRYLGLPNNIAANMRQIIYGMVLIILMFKKED